MEIQLYHLFRKTPYTQTNTQLFYSPTSYPRLASLHSTHARVEGYQILCAGFCRSGGGGGGDRALHHETMYNLIETAINFY